MHKIIATIVLFLALIWCQTAHAYVNPYAGCATDGSQAQIYLSTNVWECVNVSGGSGGTIDLGTAASATNPQRTGDAKTGIYSATAGHVTAGVNVTGTGTLALDIFNGGINIPSGSVYEIAGSQIAAANLSNGTSGSGAVVLVTSSTLVTPTLGAATATSINGNTFTTGTYTLTGTAAKTLDFTNTLTLSGTDSTTMTFPASSATVAGLAIAETWSALQKFTNADFGLLGSSTGYTLLESGLGSTSNNTLTLPTTATDTLAALGTAETWTAVQSIHSGDLALKGSSSGVTTLNANSASGTVTATLPANTGIISELNYAQTWSAAQTHNNGDLLLAGSSSGAMTLEAPAAASTYVMTFPAATDTVATLGLAQTFSNTITLSGNVNMSGLTTGTQVSCLGLTSGNAVVGSGSACGSGSGTITLGTSAAATNPQRSSEAGTGFYSAADQTVSVAANGIQAMLWNTVGSGVDYATVTPSASGNPGNVIIGASGSDSNVNLQLTTKGTSYVIVPGPLVIGTTTPQTAQITIQDNSGNVGFQVEGGSIYGEAVAINATGASGGKNWQMASYTNNAGEGGGTFCISVAGGGNDAVCWNSSGVQMSISTGLIGWGSSSSQVSSDDTGLSRDSAGVVDVGTGAQGSKAGKIQATAYQITASGKANVNFSVAEFIMDNLGGL
jgi:hypothetical protein